MIVGVYGLPGAGKTTFLAYCIDRWQHGKSVLGLPPSDTIFTNFTFTGCYQLDFDSLGRFNFKNCCMVVDEIMLLADSRNFKTFGQNLKDFFALHRRSHISLIWCSQSWDDTDKKIRNLTDYFYKLETLHGLLHNFSVIKPIKHILGPPSDCYQLSAPVEWSFIYRPKYYHLFDSYESKINQLPDPKLSLWVPLDLQTENREAPSGSSPIRPRPSMLSEKRPAQTENREAPSGSSPIRPRPSMLSEKLPAQTETLDAAAAAASRSDREPRSSPLRSRHSMQQQQQQQLLDQIENREAPRSDRDTRCSSSSSSFSIRPRPSMLSEKLPAQTDNREAPSGSSPIRPRPSMLSEKLPAQTETLASSSGSSPIRPRPSMLSEKLPAQTDNRESSSGSSPIRPRP